MRIATLPLALFAALSATSVMAANEKLRVELNAIDSGDDRCRVTFVVQNISDVPIDSLKLDIVLFRKDGSIDRRLAPDLGPLRGDKTMVRTYALRNECKDLKEVLVNDVTTCAPQASAACVDGLALSSRLSDVRLYK